jgi:hypothetical protein
MKKKKPAKDPKPRHVWAINPKTRVKPSKKNYNRKALKKTEEDWEGELLN